MKHRIDPDMPHFPQVMAAMETTNGINYPKAVSCYGTYLSAIAPFNYGGIDYLRDSFRGHCFYYNYCMNNDRGEAFGNKKT